MKTAIALLCLAVALASWAADAPPPAPDFVPLSELEAARLETIRLQVQIVNTALQSLAQRAAVAQHIDEAQYEFNFQRGGFVRKGSAPPPQQPLGPGPTSEPPPQP